ncbi:MAG: PhzF family phenazine biosynthesis protein [Jatrophihabitans sp.]|uniref:PhzF family phenazine biosynthesis protein n=1 Tax=Jatrophihabitans sp. TaxID=1932789 RepID=UPI003F806A48
MRIFVVDAFTDQPFRGNPAAVVLLERDAEPAWMQQVASEMKHSETAFVRERPDGHLDLRWFTPAAEVDLCGHATLAGAHVLASVGRRGPFAFHTRSGVLIATPRDGTIELDFPAQPATPAPVPDGLAEALDVAVIGCHRNGTDVLLEVADAATVRGLAPDIASLATVDCRGVIVTAAAGPDDDADFVSRFFAPRVGVDEDPVTGSAHCALAPFWAQRFGRSTLTGAQLSARGGRVRCDLRGQRVLLSGAAVTVLSGELV